MYILILSFHILRGIPSSLFVHISTPEAGILVASFPYVPDTPPISGNSFAIRDLFSFFHTVAQFYVFLKGEDFYPLSRSVK